MTCRVFLQPPRQQHIAPPSPPTTFRKQSPASERHANTIRQGIQKQEPLGRLLSTTGGGGGNAGATCMVARHTPHATTGAPGGGWTGERHAGQMTIGGSGIPVARPPGGTIWGLCTGYMRARVRVRALDVRVLTQEGQGSDTDAEARALTVPFCERFVGETCSTLANRNLSTCLFVLKIEMCRTLPLRDTWTFLCETRAKKIRFFENLVTFSRKKQRCFL